MKIALVHDYLREYGGAERVVEVLHEIYPEAPLYTSFVDWESLGEFEQRFKQWDIRTSWAQNWLMRRFHSPLRFLTPWVWKYFDFSKYDVVVSSSGWFICRGVDVHKPTVHISYIHHPPRNLYGYTTGAAAQSVLARAYGIVINPFLRYYDFKSAQKPDFLIANSQETRRRIKKFYRREATVIYPPIDIDSKFEIRNSKQIQNPKSKKDNYYLSVGRLTYSKRIDLIIEACIKLGRKLIIVGAGKEKEQLTSRYTLNAIRLIEFKGSVSDEELAQLYAGADALIFAAIDEDFGMVPVEAMATGTPVIAYRSGGVQESVVEGKTGIFFNELTVDSLTKAIQEFERNLKDDRGVGLACVKQAQKFSKERFKKEIEEFISEKIKNKK